MIDILTENNAIKILSDKRKDKKYCNIVVGSKVILYRKRKNGFPNIGNVGDIFLVKMITSDGNYKLFSYKENKILDKRVYYKDYFISEAEFRSLKIDCLLNVKL